MEDGRACGWCSKSSRLVHEASDTMSKNGPKTHDTEVQWTGLEKGRMFRDFKLRGRALAGVVIANLTTSGGFRYHYLHATGSRE
eukprot:5363744-Amphidinium_carterae.1